MPDDSTHIDFCPHCGNTAPQKIVLRQRHESEWYGEDGQRLMEPGPGCETIVCICQTCNEVLLYDGISMEDTGEWPPLKFPQSPDLPSSVPNEVSSIYSEASQIKRLAPNAFAVLLRRALEAICTDRGIENGTLIWRLQALAERGEVPPLLAEASDVVRILGNIGAHASDVSVTPPDTWALDDFFRAIIEYVYIGPSKLKRYKEELQKVKRLRTNATERKHAPGSNRKAL